MCLCKLHLGHNHPTLFHTQECLQQDVENSHTTHYRFRVNVYLLCRTLIIIIPVQLNPFPSKPSLHVQLKLPSVSVQLALGLHRSVPSSHSLISAEWMIVDKMHVTYPTIYNGLTCTVDPISSVARVAGAGVNPLCVSAVCILMTIVQVITLTFIDICI